MAKTILLSALAAERLTINNYGSPQIIYWRNTVVDGVDHDLSIDSEVSMERLIRESRIAVLYNLD